MYEFSQPETHSHFLQAKHIHGIEASHNYLRYWLFSICNRSVSYVVFPAEKGAMYATILTAVDSVIADV